MFLRLTDTTLVFPFDQVAWRPQALGAGSVVRVVETHGAYYLIEWEDCIGRVVRHWMHTSARSVRQASGPLRYCARTMDAPVTKADAKREASWLFTNGVSGSTLRSTSSSRTTHNPSTSGDTVMAKVTKVTKGSKSTKGPQLVDEPVKKVKKAPETATASTKRAAIAEEASTRVPATVSAGQSLMEFADAPGAKAWKSDAQKLARGETLSKTALENLRDNANVSAAEARDLDQDGVAKGLAAAVKKLRRVIRAA